MKKSKASKPIIAITMAILTMSVLPLYGCGSEEPGKTSSVSTKSSSICASSVKTSSESDMDKQKEEKEDTKEKSNTEATKEESTSEVSKEENVEELNTEAQESSATQAQSEDSTAEAEPIEVQNDNPEPAPTESYEDPGDISGRLYIPDLGINVGLYMVSAYEEYAALQQEVCDAEDSAVYQYDFPGRPLIGDHCYQSFSSLYNSYIGMPVYIYGQEYVCVDNGWGVNNGETIIIGGSDVKDINDGLTVLFTCANTSDTYDVWCVTVAPV